MLPVSFSARPSAPLRAECPKLIAQYTGCAQLLWGFEVGGGLSACSTLLGLCWGHVRRRSCVLGKIGLQRYETKNVK